MGGSVYRCFFFRLVCQYMSSVDRCFCERILAMVVWV